jgi:hypothetical protein
MSCQVYAAGRSEFKAEKGLPEAGSTPPESYTVTYDPNGVTEGAAPADQTKTEGADLTLATNTGGLARDGFAFFGWNTAADGAISVYATDLDGDGDADVLSASNEDDRIVWYENQTTD